MDATISEFTSLSGDLNRGVLSSYFPRNILEYIAACHPLMKNLAATRAFGS